MTTVGNAHDLMRMQPGPLAAQNTALEGPAPEAGLNAGDVWRAIKRRKILVTITFVVLFLLSLALTFVLWKFYPAYPAEAVLEYRPPEEIWATVQLPVTPQTLQYQIDTEAKKIKQPLVLQDVLSDQQIKATNFFKWYASFDEALEGLDDYLRVTPIANTHLIRVRIDIEDRKEAELIVDTVVSKYLQKYKSDNKGDRQSNLESVKAARDDLNNQRLQKQAELEDFRSRTDVPALGTVRDVQIAQINEITLLLNQSRAMEAQTQFELDTLRGVADLELLPLPAESQLIIEADPILRYYRQQVETLDIEIDAARRGGALGDAHRTTKRLRARRDEYFAKETQRREELIDQLRTRQREQLETSVVQLQKYQASLQDQLADAEAKQRDLDDATLKYRLMLTEQERIERSLEEIEGKILEAQAAVDEAAKEPQLRLYQKAKSEVWPSRPDFLVYVSGGFVLSALAAVALVLLIELTDQAVRTPMDVVRYGHLSVLGTVPKLDDEEADVEDIEFATRQAPHSLVAEAYRQVRTHLVFSGPLETQRVLLITSPGPEDGKTSAAANLAVTLAQGNQRVLLIDCNFRRPALRGAFRNTKADGLSNVLIGQLKFADAVTTSELPNLDVVSSGPTPPSPAELLSSQYMYDLLTEARSRYDRVILDGPPALLISDALVLATLADGVILVSRAAGNTKGELKRAREQLQRVGARILGAILNDVQANPGGYFREQYREFYDYMSDETIPHELIGASPDSLEDRPEAPPTTPDDDDDDPLEGKQA